MPGHVRLAARMATGSLRRTLLTALEAIVTDVLIFLLPVLDADQQLSWLHAVWRASCVPGASMAERGPALAALQAWQALANCPAVLSAPQLAARYLPQRRRVVQFASHGQHVTAHSVFPFAARITALLDATVGGVAVLASTNDTNDTNDNTNEGSAALAVARMEEAARTALGEDAVIALRVLGELTVDTRGRPVGYVPDFVNLCTAPSPEMTFTEQVRLCTLVFGMHGAAALASPPAVHALYHRHTARLAAYRAVCALHGGRLLPADALLRTIEQAVTVSHATAQTPPAPASTDLAVLHVVLQRLCELVLLLTHWSGGLALYRAVARVLQESIPAVFALLRLEPVATRPAADMAVARGLQRLATLIEEICECGQYPSELDLGAIVAHLAAFGELGERGVKHALSLAADAAPQLALDGLCDQLVAAETASQGTTLAWQQTLRTLWGHGHFSGGNPTVPWTVRRGALFAAMQANPVASLAGLAGGPLPLLTAGDGDGAAARPDVHVLAHSAVRTMLELSMLLTSTTAPGAASVSPLLPTDEDGWPYLASVAALQRALEGDARALAAAAEQQTQLAAEKDAENANVDALETEEESAPTPRRKPKHRHGQAQAQHVTVQSAESDSRAAQVAFAAPQLCSEAQAAIAANEHARLYFTKALMREGGGNLLVSIAATADPTQGKTWFAGGYRRLRELHSNVPPVLEPMLWLLENTMGYKKVYQALHEALIEDDTVLAEAVLTPGTDEALAVLALLQHREALLAVAVAGAWFSLVRQRGN